MEFQPANNHMSGDPSGDSTFLAATFDDFGFILPSFGRLSNLINFIGQNGVESVDVHGG